MRELSLHILDVVENSLAAEATRINIEIAECLEEDRLTIAIEDDGKGMDHEMAIRSVDLCASSGLGPAGSQNPVVHAVLLEGPPGFDWHVGKPKNRARAAVPLATTGGQA